MPNKLLTEKELNKLLEDAKNRFDVKAKQIHQMTVNDILNGVVWPETKVDAATRRNAAEYLRSVMLATAQSDLSMASDNIERLRKELKDRKPLTLLEKIINYIEELLE